MWARASEFRSPAGTPSLQPRTRRRQRWAAEIGPSWHTYRSARESSSSIHIDARGSKARMAQRRNRAANPRVNVGFVTGTESPAPLFDALLHHHEENSSRQRRSSWRRRSTSKNGDFCRFLFANMHSSCTPVLEMTGNHLVSCAACVGSPWVHWVSLIPRGTALTVVPVQV